jgi:hypothetical protein
MKIKIIATMLFLILLQYGTTQVSEYSEQLITMTETWIVQGQNINVRGTVITGSALFTVHVFVDYLPTQSEEDKALARKIAIYAIENGYLENAYVYNRYSKNVHVRKDVVGIALINVHDKKGEASGSRFAFFPNELLGEDAEIPAFPLPKTFTNIERQIIRKKIKDICDSRYFDDLYYLYSKNALDDFDMEEAKERTKVQLSLSKEIMFTDEEFTVYVGTKGGIKAYNHFIPITVIPVADEESKLDLFFKIFIVDEPEKYGIYNIELNFPDYDSFKIYMGSGNTVEFGVNPDRE